MIMMDNEENNVIIEATAERSRQRKLCEKTWIREIAKQSRYRVQNLCRKQLSKGASPKEKRAGDRRTQKYEFWYACHLSATQKPNEICSYSDVGNSRHPDGSLSLLALTRSLTKSTILDTRRVVFRFQQGDTFLRVHAIHRTLQRGSLQHFGTHGYEIIYNREVSVFYNFCVDDKEGNRVNKIPELEDGGGISTFNNVVYTSPYHIILTVITRMKEREAASVLIFMAVTSEDCDRAMASPGKTHCHIEGEGCDIIQVRYLFLSQLVLSSHQICARYESSRLRQCDYVFGKTYCRGRVARVNDLMYLLMLSMS
uniref:(California timema) hypothetical protein n=1 Tax=Timema californicum TaxID=61474 RepID=A0A7R9JDE5_TIMCA|nr:unnamed protein product [Timema californicum]